MFYQNLPIFKAFIILPWVNNKLESRMEEGLQAIQKHSFEMKMRLSASQELQVSFLSQGAWKI